MIQLRAILESDLAVFFEHQREPEACRIAAFPSRNREAFFSHWKNNILANDSVPAFAIDFDGQTAGYVLSWKGGECRLVGFWLGRAYWSRGIATRALSDFLRVVTERPLYAHVARENMASIRVLEKCGFVIDPIATDEYAEPDDGVSELVLFLRTPEGDIQVPESLLNAYASFIETTKEATEASLATHCVTGAVRISTERRPQNPWMGQDMNVPFLRSGEFQANILQVQQLDGQGYFFRTGSSGLRLIQTDSGIWKISDYFDKPID